MENNLSLINPPEEQLEFKPAHTTFVDLTLMGYKIAEKVVQWRFLTTLSLSYHYYIYFTLNITPKRRKRDPARLPTLENIETNVAEKYLKLNLASKNGKQLNSTEEIDDEVNKLTNTIRDALLTSITPSKPINKKSVWWTKELCGLRHQLRKLQKTSRKTVFQREIFNKQKSLYQRELTQAKSHSWKQFCKDEFEADPFKALRKITCRTQTKNDYNHNGWKRKNNKRKINPCSTIQQFFFQRIQLIQMYKAW